MELKLALIFLQEILWQNYPLPFIMRPWYPPPPLLLEWNLLFFAQGVSFAIWPDSFFNKFLANSDGGTPRRQYRRGTTVKVWVLFVCIKHCMEWIITFKWKTSELIMTQKIFQKEMFLPLPRISKPSHRSPPPFALHIFRLVNSCLLNLPASPCLPFPCWIMLGTLLLL